MVLASALTPGTRAPDGRAELAAMAPDPWLVNVARGELVDTEALVEAFAEATRRRRPRCDRPEPLPTATRCGALPTAS